MKIIEAMRELERLHEKTADLRAKAAQFCADMDYENPHYQDQGEQIRQWIQSHEDTVERILFLRTAIQRTNLETLVTIELGGHNVTKSIAEWIHRRGNGPKKEGLARLDLAMWATLGDRGLKDGWAEDSTGHKFKACVRRYFAMEERDGRIALYTAEPSIIDGRLEVINAVTDLIEVNDGPVERAPA